jgi:hypothetical protein
MRPHDLNGPCPECGADWRGKPISTESLLAGHYGEWNEGDEPRYYSRLIGCELAYDHPQHYDGVSYWQCPDCKATWNRFTGTLEPIPAYPSESA